MILQPLSGGNTSQNKTSTSSRVLQPLSSIKSSEKVTTPTKFSTGYSYSPTAYKSALDKPLISKPPEPEAPQTPKSVWDNIQRASSEVTAKILLLNKEDKNNGLVAKVGRKLQQVPNADLGSKGQKLFKSTDTETKIVNFISNLPSSFLQSWGQHLENLDTPEGREKLKVGTMELPQTMGEVKTHIWNKDWQKAVETAMDNPAFMLAIDTSDFIPITGLTKAVVKKGLTSTFKQGAKESVEQIIKEVPAETRKLAQTIVKEALDESEKELKTVKPLKAETIKPKISNPKTASTPEHNLKMAKESGRSFEDLLNDSLEMLKGRTGFDTPPQTVKVYRGVSQEGRTIRSGDWVTTNPEYAKKYGGVVQEIEVPAKDLKYMNGSAQGNAMGEFPEYIFTGKSSPLPQGVNSLSQEARKYKSAEEFVGGQPKLYRGEGGANQFSGKTGFIAGKNYAIDAERAGTFGKVGEYSLTPNSKVLKINTVGKELDVLAKELGVSESSILSPAKLKQELSAKGYDAVEYTTQLGKNGKLDPNGKIVTDVIVLNDKAVVSRSQLTDIWNKANKPTKEKKSSKPRPEELDPETRSLLTGSQAQEANATKPIDKRTQAELKDRLEELEIRRSKVDSDRAILSNFDSDMLKGVRRIQRKLAIIEKRGGDPTEVTNDKAYKTYIEDLMAFLNTNSEDKAIDYLLNDFPEPIRRVSTKEDLEEIRYLKSKLNPKEVEVPRDQIPVGKGKEKVSRLEARVKNVLKNAPEETKEGLGLSTYNQMNRADQIKKATEYVAKHPDDALKIIKGDLEAPQGILKNSIYVALENYAVLGKDMNLARKIASLESTRLGQEINILSELNPESPVKIIRDVIKVREEAFENRYRGKSAKQVSNKVVKDIQKRVKTPDKYDWNKFVESIKC